MTEKIKKVYVVFKTHLDIGFTDLGKNVLEKYVQEYIPASVELALRMNGEREKKFIWTVGSFLIDYYLRKASPEQARRLETAIRRGDICWHALACTTHTELADEELFNFDLGIAQELDKRFGRRTIAAKMTDVPGHTRAIVGPLAAHGVCYLHIGVNASSMVPETPETFVWKDGADEVLVQYSAQYGAACYVPGMETALEFAHTGDNLGPQSEADVQRELDRIQQKYPGAQITAATMDDYARELLAYREHLPVVEEEIGDTWIHGVTSAPLRVARYETLLRLKTKWLAEGKLRRETEAYRGLMMNLLLVAEHTWGLDYKKYLADFCHWEKADFQKAREADRTTLDFLTNRNAQMLDVLQSDIEKYRGGVFTGSYRFYESSYAEQDGYVDAAVEALPPELRAEAAAEMEKLTAEPVTAKAQMGGEGKPAAAEVQMNGEGKPAAAEVQAVGGAGKASPDAAVSLFPGQRIAVGAWQAAFDGSGALVYLSRGGQEWIRGGCFGRLGYAVYNARDCVEQYYSYNRAFRENECWSEGDFSKPGLETAESLPHREYPFGACGMVREGSRVVIRLAGDEEACGLYGCPRRATLEYSFGETVTLWVRWHDKDANRMPEALWLDARFDVENENRFRLCKMGKMIAPLDVVRGGNRHQHCVQSIEYRGADGSLSLRNAHSPLVSVGGRWLYGDYRSQPDLSKGFSYCLFNNKWGTNFNMWSEDDCGFFYELEIRNAGERR